ncbi:MAG: feruloyl-CoA synthase [Hyphomicrobiales bacterium]|nr:MAG: feruloyl-CoA synthase [Hyphomicrobiales bacterium]
MAIKKDITNKKLWLDAELRSVKFDQVKIIERQTDDGIIYIDQVDDLPAYNSRITERLVHFANLHPNKIYLADRGEDGEWRTLSYIQVLQRVKSLGQFLIDNKVSESNPLAILSGNSLEHALLALAAAHVGATYAPISPAYSIISKDFSRLEGIFNSIKPSMIFATDIEKFLPAIQAVATDVKIITTKPTSEHYIDFAEIVETQQTDAVVEAFNNVSGETIVKFLFTSGSTGSPKAVINTHKMICSNNMMVREAFTFVKDEAPVMLDWAPWNHTAGGNQVFFMALFNGGTLYIDDGRPTANDIHKTIRNIKDISPTWYFNVPKGLDALTVAMANDIELREAFYKNLNMIWYAGAGLAQHTWDALEQMAVETTGTRILIGTGLGATETAPAALFCTWPQTAPGNIGLPGKGQTLKLVPFEGKYDARLKGSNITPGYWQLPELTAKAFDEEGFYKLGDALRPFDVNDFSKGFMFDGRTAENFKLDTGTWVATGALRSKFINHFGDIVNEVTITGADQSYLGGLVFPNFQMLRKILGSSDVEISDILNDETIRNIFREKLISLAKQNTGSSTLIRKILLLSTPPSLENHELTDKGSVNQRAVLTNRPELVDEIYAGSSRIISI